jgi:hypothetical protein
MCPSDPLPICCSLPLSLLPLSLLPLLLLHQVGAIRTQSPSGRPALSPVTCMAWHPYNLYLGAASSDSVASVYIVDNVPSSNLAAAGVSYAPTSISSIGQGGGGPGSSISMGL